MNNRSSDHYQVPRRFGLRTILFVTALIATLLAVVQWTEASPEVMIVAFSFVALVSSAQALFEKSPRMGSILAGAVFLAVLKLAAWGNGGGLEAINIGPLMGLVSDGSLIFTLVFGAFYGYLVGTLLASLYLVLDKIQLVAHWRYKPGRLPTEAS